MDEEFAPNFGFNARTMRSAFAARSEPNRSVIVCVNCPVRDPIYRLALSGRGGAGFIMGDWIARMGDANFEVNSAGLATRSGNIDLVLSLSFIGSP
jgi:hypothetical protein